MLIINIHAHTFAQENKALILKEPANWKYEKIDLPLDFAKDIEYKGYEEIRFAPGMFNRDSGNYFTYMFVMSLNDMPKINKKELTSMMLKYFKGLAKAVAEAKKLNINTEEINFEIISTNKSQNLKKSHIAKATFLDVFNNGEKVYLNLNIEITKSKKYNRTYIFSLLSIKSLDKKIWSEMIKFRENTILYN